VDAGRWVVWRGAGAEAAARRGRAIAAGRLTGPPMPPVAGAVLPHPPLLVPELAGAAAAELEPLRAACREALTAVVEAADITMVVGDGPVWGVPEPSAPGSFHPYGADVEVTLPVPVALGLPGLPAPARLTDLPLSLAVAAHLLAGLDRPPARSFAATVPASLGPGAAAAIGRALTTAARELATAAPGAPGAGARGGRVGLVAMGDLSARRTEGAPGAFQATAAGFDTSVAEAFRTATPQRLLALDPAQAADLLVAGLAPLQVLAGAFEDAAAPDGVFEDASAPGGVTRVGPGSAVRGRVLYEDAPYGVGYLVALLRAT
jgi:hypothetical protein